MNTRQKKIKEPRYIGRIYKRKGNNRLYIVLQRTAASLLGITRDIATGIQDTKEGREEAEELLVALTHKYNAVRGGYSNALGSQHRTTGLTIKQAFDRFVEQHGAQRSANSVRNYKLAYNAVLHHGEERKGLADESAHGGKKQLYVEHLLEMMITTRRTAKGAVTPETCEIYARTFLIFLQWSFDEGLMPRMASRKRIRKLHPHMPGKAIKIYGQDEIDQLTAYCYREGASTSERRIGHLISVLARTPLRIHEALTTRLGDIDMTTHTLKVQRKDGRQWEYVPLMARDVEMLKQIAAETGAKNPADRILGYRETSTSRLRRTYLTVAKDAEVELNGRLFHEYKKTYITRMVQRVGKDLSLQEVSRLARCGLQVLEKHYLRMGSEHLREKLNHVFGDTVEIQAGVQQPNDSQTTAK